MSRDNATIIETLTVALGDRSYPIHIGAGALSVLPETLQNLGARGVAAICSDTNVAPLYADKVAGIVAEAGLRPAICSMPAGEEHKRIARVEEFTGAFIEAGLDRSSVVIALGGGVVGDVVGYAAASYMRGVRFVQIPTTIVAQVDSSVGGKTGVNHPLAKNMIGAFHQPSAVIIDLTLLSSLPNREFRAGLAEVIKHGVIADAALFDYMEASHEAIGRIDLPSLIYPIKRSCAIKGAIVAADERENGVRANLNYGHTFGHGIEAVTKYSVFLHGEAIALGMHAAAELGKNLGLVDEAFVTRQNRCMEQYGLPIAWPELPVNEVVEAMRRDKKVRHGTMKFIVPEGMGRVIHRLDVTEEQARQALEAVRG
ncbi:MAG: 3-dehydroquinate synthase [Candidatus Hydrogenedentota bacterium]